VFYTLFEHSLVYMLKASKQGFLFYFYFFNGYVSYEAHSIEIKQNRKYV